ncbi:MAG: hypothetical protein IPP17_30725 [Bacteroidetes bacterium]|nr:hypothetical protein [Bacteroidota bacterium]
MVQVKVYSVSGKLVKTLQDNFFAEGNLYCDLEWDGLDDYGDAIGRGVYVYEIVVKDETTGDRISSLRNWFCCIASHSQARSPKIFGLGLGMVSLGLY